MTSKILIRPVKHGLMILLPLIVVLTLSGCGQIGPLYLPKPKTLTKEHKQNLPNSGADQHNIDKKAARYT